VRIEHALIFYQAVIIEYCVASMRSLQASEEEMRQATFRLFELLKV
jgi:hypothetical protein